MSTVLIDLSQAVTDMINNASLSQSVTAIRAYANTYDTSLEQTMQLYVTGTNWADDLAGGSRVGIRTVASVLLTIYNKISRDINGNLVVSEIDEMVEFAGEVCDLFLRNIRPTNYNSAVLIGTRNGPVFDPTLLENNSVFSYQVALDYMLLR